MDLARWHCRKACSKKQLLSLIGQLSHAAKVVKPRRTFLHWLIVLSTSARELYHHIYLNASARAWWWSFGSQRNRVGLLASPSPSVSLFTDASGAWGYGGLWYRHWFKFQLPLEWLLLNITVNKLLPIVVSAATWGHCRCDKSVLCFPTTWQLFTP